MSRLIDASLSDFSHTYARLIAAREESLEPAEHAARDIIAQVRAKGMEAVLAYGAKFDGVSLQAEQLRVTTAELDAAVAACPDELIAALKQAAARVRAFHERQRPEDAQYTDEDGVTLGWRWTPVDAAGLYAPGGLAAYPSSVLMNAIPAKVAGVQRLAMVTPPGKLNQTPAILAAARIAGVDEVWRVGGAQAIAALAYGAGGLKPVDVIVGPGNAYVAAAKKLVFGDVGVDSIAGPSEVFILADETAPPTWLAADLMAQAEHDLDAQSVLFTTSKAHGEAVAQAVEAMLARGEAGPCAAESWRRHGAIIVMRDLADACPLVDQAAPEHVQIVARNAEALAAKIRHAGALFLGAHAPEALGDYVAGPNHVLPTGRRARFQGGLSTLAFMKRTTIIKADAAAVARIGPAAARMADAEGLPAHARSVRLRLGSTPGSSDVG
jgi:histidinol dehydrogenase